MKKLFWVIVFLAVLSSIFALRTCRISGDPAVAATDHHSSSTEPQIVAGHIDGRPMRLWDICGASPCLSIKAVK